MTILFKLKCGEEVRRLTLPDLPTWAALSSRLTSLYGIAPDNIGVAYTDSDGDEITLNTQEELLDYYESCHAGQQGQTLRLKVVDLTSLRGVYTTSPKVASWVPVEGEDDWQRLPSLHGVSDLEIFRGSMDLDGTHTFVEVPASDAKVEDPPINKAAEHSSSASTILPLPRHGKDVELRSFDSTASLIDDEPGEKHPIHIRECSNDDTLIAGAGLSTAGQTTVKEEVPVASFPDTAEAALTGNEDQEDDPPLPSIPSPVPSLTEDIATLLASLNTAAEANPELLQNLRRIVQNTTSGTYWRTHRDSLHQTVQDMTQSMGVATDEFRRNTEAEAARRISNTLGSLFQSLTAMSPTQSSRHDGAGTGPDADHQGGPDSPHLPGGFPRTHGHSTHHHGRRFGPPWTPATSIANAPVPPPPAAPPSLLSTEPPAASDTFVPASPQEDSSHPDPTPGETSQVPSAPPKGPPRFSGSAPGGTDPQLQSSAADRIWDPETRPSWLPAPPSIEHQTSQGRQSAQELLAAVEAAKEQYKAEKERYRKEREERKRQKEEKRAVNATSKPNTESLPVSRQASSNNYDYPSALARPVSHLTNDSHVSANVLHRRESTIRKEQEHARAVSRIVQKLGDMGFPSTSYPELPGEVQARLSQTHHKALNKEIEDNVVTDLLEILLASSARTMAPIASGSGGQHPDSHNYVPGGWH